MNYPPHYPPPPGSHGYGAPPPPQPPSTGGNTAVVVVMSVVAALVLLVVVVVVALVLLAPEQQPQEEAAAPEPAPEPETEPGGEPDPEAGPTEYDGVWEGTFTQFSPDGSVHGLWDLTVELEDGVVVHAEETSSDFDYDLCEWSIVEQSWSGQELSLEYEVIPEHQPGQTCMPTGDLSLTFTDDEAVGVSNVTSEGVLEPAD